MYPAARCEIRVRPIAPDKRRDAKTARETSGEVKIWDAETGAVLFGFTLPPENALFQLAWSPDGTHLTESSSADSIEIYRVSQTTEDLMAYAKECCVVRDLTPEERQQFGLR